MAVKSSQTEASEVRAYRESARIYLQELIRHLNKDNTMERAGFFEGDGTNMPWDNRTVLAVLQEMIGEYIRREWAMEWVDRQLYPDERTMMMLGMLKTPGGYK